MIMLLHFITYEVLDVPRVTVLLTGLNKQQQQQK